MIVRSLSAIVKHVFLEEAKANIRRVCPIVFGHYPWSLGGTLYA